MELFWDTAFQVVLTVLGSVLTFFATKVGTYLGKWLKGKYKEETIRNICRTCVFAVEQMYRDLGGEEKLKKALDMGEKQLLQKGIKVDFETLHCLLESALAEAKGAFEKQ